jgi:hypothetical protein
LALPPPPRFSWQDQLQGQHAAFPHCPCREGLAILIPNAYAALAERRTDQVFKVTGDVIRTCRAITKCALCEMRCADLICITAVFQEADKCFDYFAQVRQEDGNDAPVTVHVGAYDVPVGDSRTWKDLLVKDLVRQARALLDELSAKGQSLLGGVDPGMCRLAEINIRYLEMVIANSRENLDRLVGEAS